MKADPGIPWQMLQSIGVNFDGFGNPILAFQTLRQTQDCVSGIWMQCHETPMDIFRFPPIGHGDTQLAQRAQGLDVARIAKHRFFGRDDGIRQVPARPQQVSKLWCASEHSGHLSTISRKPK